jgi:hypothetical protein
VCVPHACLPLCVSLTRVSHCVCPSRVSPTVCVPHACLPLCVPHRLSQAALRAQDRRLAPLLSLTATPPSPLEWTAHDEGSALKSVAAAQILCAVLGRDAAARKAFAAAGGLQAVAAAACQWGYPPLRLLMTSCLAVFSSAPGGVAAMAAAEPRALLRAALKVRVRVRVRV